MTPPVSGGVPEQGLREAAQEVLDGCAGELGNEFAHPPTIAALKKLRAALEPLANAKLPSDISWLDVERARAALERPRPALPAPPSAGKRQRALEQIVAVMREKGLALDVLVSEIQDFLTMAGYDVPLRSYDTREGAALPALKCACGRVPKCDCGRLLALPAFDSDGEPIQYQGPALPAPEPSLEQLITLTTELWDIRCAFWDEKIGAVEAHAKMEAAYAKAAT